MQTRPLVRSLARAAVIVAPLEIPLDLTELSAPPTSDELLRRRRDLPFGRPDRATIRAQVVETNLPMATRLARRYGSTGQRFHDLAQVAALALVKVVDAYDPDRRVPFAGYAVPSIIGALKRYFRDSTWATRVPRGTKGWCCNFGRPPPTSPNYAGSHRRPPSWPHTCTCRSMMSGPPRSPRRAYRLESLDTPRMRHDDHPSGDTLAALGAIEPRYAQTTNLRWAL
jgi:RNA polymerase sigma-B factor